MSLKISLVCVPGVNARSVLSSMLPAISSKVILTNGITRMFSIGLAACTGWFGAANVVNSNLWVYLPRFPP